MRIAGVYKSIAQFVRDEVAAQKPEAFLWWPVFLGFGIGFYFSLHFEPPSVLGLGVFTVLAMLYIVLRHHRAGVLLFLICLSALGFTAAQMRTGLQYTPMLEKESKPLEMVAVISEIEKLEPGAGSRIVFRDITIEGMNPLPDMVRLRVRKDEGLKVGQKVKALVKLSPPSPPIMPGGFDFQRHLYFKRIGAVGFAFNAPEILEEPQGAWQDFSESFRERIAARIDEKIRHPQSAIANALIVAERGEITESDAQAMRDSGLAHLLAISGLHIGLFSGVVFFAVRLFLALMPGMALRYPIKKYAAVAAFFAACFYVFLAGAPVSAQRALIMIGLGFAAILLDRSPFSLRLVSCAAFVVLLIQPESLLSPGFQMSFAAVTGLIAFYGWLRPYSASLYRQSGFMKRGALYFLSAVMTSVIASAATAPFVLFHFQNMPTFSVLANVVAVPMTAFVIMPSAVMALFLMPAGLEQWPLNVMSVGIEQVLMIAHWFAELPGAAVHVGVYPHVSLIFLVLGVLILIVWRGYGKWVSIVFVVAALMTSVLMKTFDVLVSPEFALAMFQDEGGALHVSSKRKEKFVAEGWEQSYGEEPGSAVKWPAEGGDEEFFCDAGACRLTLNGGRLSFLKDLYEFDAECEWADVVISFEHLGQRECGDVIVKDPRNGSFSGAYGFWIDANGVRYTNARRQRGVRPWTVY